MRDLVTALNSIKLPLKEMQLEIRKYFIGSSLPELFLGKGFLRTAMPKCVFNQIAKQL